MRESHQTRQVHLDLLVELLEVESPGVRQIIHPLETRVQEETVDVGLGHDGLHELRDLADVGQVEWKGCHSVRAILLHQLLQTVLATAHDGDSDARVQQPFRQSESNAGGGPDEQDVSVREGHWMCTGRSR